MYLLIYNFYFYSYWSVKVFWIYQLKCCNVRKGWTVTPCGQETQCADIMIPVQ